MLTSKAIAKEAPRLALFKCKTEISFFSQEIQQGDDLRINLYYHPQQDAFSLEMIPWVGAVENIYDATETSRYSANLKNSTFLVIWKEHSQSPYSAPYMSLVYLGNLKWGAVIRLDEKAQHHEALRDLYEIELMCTETEALSLINFPEN